MSLLTVLTICIVSKTKENLVCSCMLLKHLEVLFLFGTYSSGSGKIWSICTLGQGKRYHFAEKSQGKSGNFFLNNAYEPCVQIRALSRALEK